MIAFSDWLARTTLRLVRGLVILVLALGLAGLAVVFGLAWRLAQGPVDLAWALPRVEAALNRPGTPTSIGVDGATLAWTGFTSGPDSGLDLKLSGLLVREGDRVLARTASLSVVLVQAGFGLLPRSIEASGVELHMVRQPGGAVSLDLGGLDLGDPGDAAPDLVQAMQELARPPPRDSRLRSELQAMQQLRRVRLSDSRLTLLDREMGGLWRLDLAGAALDRLDTGGVLGDAAATLRVGAVRAGLTLRAELMPDGGTSLNLVLAPTAAAAVQREAASQGADIAEGGMLDTAVQGSAQLLLNAGLLPSAASIRLSSGGGLVRVAGTPIGFDSLELEAQAAWPVPAWTRPATATLSRMKAVVHAPGGAWPSTLLASGTVQRDGERLLGTAKASIDHVAFADIGRLWPERLGGHVRPWLVKSVTAGTARDAAIALSFTASSALSDLVLTKVDGSVAGDDATIHWLRPVPPVERAQALLTIRSPEVLDIAITSARQGGVALSNGALHITGLNVKDQFMTLAADASGPVAEVVQLLRHPRLRLLDRKPIPMRNPGGTVNGRLGVFLPLNEDLDFDDVKVSAKVRATDLRLGGLVAGRDLERGDVTLEATSDSLKAQGRAAISGLPTDLIVEMDFRNGGPGQVVQRAQGTTRASPQQLAAAGLDTGGIVEGGQLTSVARYLQRRDGSGELTLNADLRDAALSLAGWSKPPGQAAEASARLLLRGDQMLGLDQLHATGPGLLVEGRADMVGDRPLLLRLDRLTLGGTQGRGDVQLPSLPGEPIRARLDGPVLDLSALLARKPGAARGAEAPWTADIRFDRVLLSGDRGLAGVSAHAESRGGKVMALRAASTGPERLEASIDRTGGGRRLLVTAADGGAVLRAMDLIDSVQGGTLRIDALYDDSRAEPPLRGTLTLDGFRVRNAPGLGKLLQAVTVYGVLEALSGPGLSFVALSMPFDWNGTVLDVSDVQAFSVSLGLTAKGRVDSLRKTIDLQGTVVPLYVLNSMLGRIPLLGRLFSAEKGGGLLAMNYSLRGPVGDPAVAVNPLSALTPGFLRGLFKVLD